MHDEHESPLLNNIPLGFNYPGSVGAGAASEKGGAGNGRQGFGPGLTGNRTGNKGNPRGSMPLDDGRPGWGSVAAFKDPPPAMPNPGPVPARLPANMEAMPGDGPQGNSPTPFRNLRFIPPLAMFNDASQWVNLLLFHKVLPWLQNPDSNPALHAQYAIGPRPINALRNAAAGQMNLQLQLGNLSIQASQLTLDASNYFGG